MSSIRQPELPPLSLYIHVPWCVRKCPYCDFNSHTSKGELPESEYIKALLDDLSHDAQRAHGRPIQSIFIGGGTPSLLSSMAYERLFSGITEQLTLTRDCEITMEANPGTFEAERFKGYRQAGINRLSIGIQSLQDDLLKALGRIHGRDEALRAIEIAQAAGFDNLNLDLMHGLPGQSLEQAMDDLKTALAFKPSHLSWYQLTIEPNTEFYKETPQLPHEEVLWDIQEAGQEILAAEGMAHYEVSAYSRSGYQSRHNVNYWQFGDYIGIGAGAHGKLTQPDGQIVRTRKTRLPEHYLSRYHSASNNSSTNNSFVYRPGNLVPTFGNPYCAEETPIAKQDVGLECLMNALRLNAGILVSDFEKRTGLTLEEVRKPLNLAINKGLLSVDERLAPTELGRQYLNELLSIFLTD